MSLHWHAEDAAAVASHLGSRPEGLPAAEARARLERDGPNALPEAPPPGALQVLLHQFQSPLIYILLIAAVVTVLVEEYLDAGVIAAVLALNAIIGFWQERRAEESVRALMQLLSPKARVLRDAREREIESRELVAGDVVLLESGARIPADLRLFSTTALRVDESLLTGESVPVTKTSEALEGHDRALGDRRNMAYMGTIVATGRGHGYVVATGLKTQLGTIAESMRTGAKTETPLQKRMTRFAHLIGFAVALSAGVTFVVGLLMGQPAAHMLMVAVALAVAAVPEGLPVVFTITLALGVRRMARRNAIIRRLPAVETLGSTTVIGSDKTGTLTENRMTVQEVWAAGETTLIEGGVEPKAGSPPASLDDATPLQLTMLTGVLTNEASLARDGDRIDIKGDPTEAALLVSAGALGIDPAAARAAFESVAELPFEPERQLSASVRLWNGAPVLCVKGAPERLLALSSAWRGPGGVEPLDRDAVLDAARGMAQRGLRVLGMAYRVLDAAPREGVPEPRDLVFVGLQGMMDPPRAGVRESIEGCRRAGIRVMMITGDHADTARAIGRQLGIAADDTPVVTGADLEKMDDDTLRRKVPEVSVFARVAPEHKLRVVQALRANGDVVAVTGDGVNDAPALKAAEIGIAMGRSGTDVAREASDMVLADDNFVSIQAAVEEGRITFDNLRKVTFFLVSTGAGLVIMIIAALVLGWPLPMVAAQLLWLNLVTNGLQDVALAFEPGEPGILNRPPRASEEGVMSRLLWERTLIAGVVMAVGTLSMFRWQLDAGDSLPRAQTVALTTMVLFQMFHLGNSRSEYLSVFRKNPLSNPFLFVATAAALLVHIGALYFPLTQTVLRVEPLEAELWQRMVLVASSILVVIEVHKLVRRDPYRQTASRRKS